MNKVSEREVNQAFENEFDGVEPFLLVQEILELKAENKALKLKMQIHAGDICSANNETDLFINMNKELEDENEKLKSFLVRWDGHASNCQIIHRCDCGYEKARAQALKAKQ